MNHRVSALCCVLLLSCVAYGAGNPASQPAKTATFSDKENRFSFDYPSQWKKPKLLKDTPVKVVVRPTADKTLRLQVAVSFTPIKPENLKSLSDVALGLAKDGGKVIDDADAKLDGVAAHRIEYTKKSPQTDAEIQVRQIICIRDGKLYQIEFSGPLDGFAKFKDDADAIVQSFKWIAADK